MGAVFRCLVYLRDSRRFVAIFGDVNRPYRLAVRTPPFHGGGTGSIPVRVAIPFQGAANSPRLMLVRSDSAGIDSRLELQ